MVVPRSWAVGGLLDGGKSVLDRSRAVLGSNLALGVVAGSRLEGHRGLHSVCASYFIVFFYISLCSNAILVQFLHSLSTFIFS